MTTAPSPATVPIYLEQGNRWVFACSLDWPGWCRRGRSEELALEQPAAYAPRYAAVADRAGLAWQAGPAAAFTVTERLTSDFGADFGAPCEIPQADATPADAGQAQQMTALVRAAWEIFDLTAATAPPPRGHLCS